MRTLSVLVLAGCAAVPTERTNVPSPPTSPVAASEPAPRDPRIESLVAEGRDACLAKQWALALPLLDEAVAIAADDVEARRWRGHAYTGAERPAEAFADLEHALRCGADDAWTHYARAMALHNLGRFEEAVRGYSDALAIDPAFYKACEWRGFTLARLGRPVEALPDLDLALSLDRGNPWLSAIRGKVRASLLDFAGAEADLWRAVDADGADADAVAQLGYLLATNANPERGIALLERAVRLAPDKQLEARAWLVQLLRQRGGDDEAKVHAAALRANGSPWLRALADGLDGRLDGEALVAAASSTEPGAPLDERSARRVAAWTHRALLAERAGEAAKAIEAHARAVAAVRSEQWEWVWSLRRLGALTGEGTR